MSTLWQTYVLPPEHAYISWARCLWCGARGHFREDCVRIHSHGAVTRDGVCLGCGGGALSSAQR